MKIGFDMEYGVQAQADMVYALELTAGVAQAFAAVAEQFDMLAPKSVARGGVDSHFQNSGSWGEVDDLWNPQSAVRFEGAQEWAEFAPFVKSPPGASNSLSAADSELKFPPFAAVRSFA